VNFVAESAGMEGKAQEGIEPVECGKVFILQSILRKP
jgi:hypothetical protein